MQRLGGAVALVGVVLAVVVTCITTGLMHARMTMLEIQLAEARAKARAKRPLAPSKSPASSPQPVSLHRDVLSDAFSQGFTVAGAQAAVESGIDVRLAQDGLPLRLYQARQAWDASEIHIDYQQCTKLITAGKGKPPKPLGNPPHSPDFLHWLHLPKCGSSFGALLYGMVCQAAPSPPVSPYTGEPCDYCGLKAKGSDRWDSVLWDVIDFGALPYCNWNVTTSTPRANFRNHVPLPLDQRPMQKWQVMGLFREPRKRLVSGWNHDKHAMGIDGADRVHFEKTVQTIEDYARYRAIPACATKMLIGAYCARTRNITTHAFEEARRRLLSMKFVGLTDAFDASACLFCRMFGIQPQPFMFGSRAHARPGSMHTSHKLPGGGERVPRDYWKRMAPSIDPLDWELYSEAKAIFLARLQEYGLFQMDYRDLEKGIQAG